VAAAEGGEADRQSRRKVGFLKVREKEQIERPRGEAEEEAQEEPLFIVSDRE
jgi:hypothetical protein